MKEIEINRQRDITVSFRISENEKRLLDARIEACGMKKAQYYLRSALYTPIVVVGSREHIDRLIEELNEMEVLLKLLLDEIRDGDIKRAGSEISQIREDYIAMVKAIYEVAVAGNRDIK